MLNKREAMVSGNTYIDLIIGTIAAIGGIILLFYRLGLITFGKKENPVDKETPCNLKKCPSHDAFEVKLNTLHDNHIVSHKLHEQHEKKFADGKIEFESIKSSLKTIGENIAVLKDRSDREERLK